MDGGYNSYQNGTDRRDFNQTAQNIGSNIQKILQNVVSMKKMVNVLGTSQDTPELRLKLHQIQHYTNNLARDTSDSLLMLNNIPFPQSTENKECKMQKERLVDEFTTALNAFQQSQHLALEKEKKDIAQKNVAAKLPAPPSKHGSSHDDQLIELTPSSQTQAQLQQEEMDARLLEQQQAAMLQLEESPTTTMKKSNPDRSSRTAPMSGIKRNATNERTLKRQLDESKQNLERINKSQQAKNSTRDIQMQTVSPSFTNTLKQNNRTDDIEKILIPMITTNTCKHCGKKYSDSIDSKLDAENLGALIAKFKAEIMSRNARLTSTNPVSPDIPNSTTQPISIIKYENIADESTSSPTSTAAAVLCADNNVPEPLNGQPSEQTNEVANEKCAETPPETLVPVVSESTSKTEEPEKEKVEETDTSSSKTLVLSNDKPILINAAESPKSLSKSTISSTKSKKSLFNRKSSMNAKNKKIYKSYGKYIAEELKTMPPEKAVVCQRLINETLTHGLMGQLNNTSRVSSISSKK